MTNVLLIWVALLRSSSSDTMEQPIIGSASSSIQEKTIVAEQNEWFIPNETKWAMVGTGEEMRQTICRDPDQALQNMMQWVGRWRDLAEEPKANIKHKQICNILKNAKFPEEYFDILCMRYHDFMSFLAVNQDIQFPNSKHNQASDLLQTDTEWEILYQRMTVDMPPNLLQANPIEPKNNDSKIQTT